MSCDQSLLHSQSAPERHNQEKKPIYLCAPREFLKQMCQPRFKIIKSCYFDNNAVSQSFTVAKSETFWRATGQSNLVYKQVAATKASKVWFSYSHNCTLASGAVFHYVCQVSLSSGQWNSLPFCLPRLIVQWPME